VYSVPYGTGQSSEYHRLNIHLHRLINPPYHIILRSSSVYCSTSTPRDANSPLSIIPKSNKPGKFRLAQNFSFPHALDAPILSINTQLDSSLHPCTWGTFSTMALCITRLPPGSQAAARDEAEAYRTMPLHLSQWNGTVIRIGEDAFPFLRPWTLSQRSRRLR
jgi:hypothetical protein